MRHTNQNAFTLIELLMVLAAIGLLIGVTLPLLGRVRHQARVATCAGNAGAIATAFGAFLEDHQGVYPNDGDMAKGWILSQWNLMGKQGEALRGLGTAPENVRPLNPYLQTVDLARCPLDLGTNQTLRRTWCDLFGSSYTYDNRSAAAIRAGIVMVQWGVWFIEGHRAEQVKYPSKKLLISDEIRRLTHPANHLRNQWHNPTEPLHISVAFADGHSQELPRKIGTGPDQPAAYDRVQLWRKPTAVQLQQLDDWALNTDYY